MVLSSIWNLFARVSFSKIWQTRKKIAGRKPFFRIQENFFQSFRTNCFSLCYMIPLAYKTSQCLSANHNSELRCVICTSVTLFALVLHLNCNCSPPFAIFFAPHFSFALDWEKCSAKGRPHHHPAESNRGPHSASPGTLLAWHLWTPTHMHIRQSYALSGKNKVVNKKSGVDTGNYGHFWGFPEF